MSNEQTITRLSGNLDVMTSNLDYVRRELDDLKVDEALTSRLDGFCRRLAGAVEELRAHLPDAATRPDAMQAELAGWMEQLHEQVMAVDKLAEEKRKYEGVGILFRESAANILMAFIQARENLRSLVRA